MSISTEKNIAIVLASGAGTRFRSDTPKQFLKLAGKSVLEHTLDAFEQHPRIDEIVVVVSAECRMLTERVISDRGYRKIGKMVAGGDSRQASSASGIAAVVGESHKVLVHDAVRPLLDAATIDRCLIALDDFDAVDTGILSPDTIIRVQNDGSIAEIPDRSMLRLGQTPQGFRAGLLRRAHELARNDPGMKVTDDCGLVLHYGLGQVHVVAGDVNNIKITYPSDIYLADRLFQLRTRELAVDVSGKTLKDKIVVVFGASRGIGARITALAREQGALIKAVSRSTGVNVAKSEDVRAVLQGVVREHGHVDMVVNTAGVLRTGLLAGQRYAQIDEQIDVNLRGSIVVAREAFEVMRETGGSIALFASSSYTRGRAHSSVYSATKAAVVNLMQALAQEYQPFGVRINAINPDRTSTPMRTENFGHEPADELLDANTVASATLSALLSDASGEIIDVRR